MRKRGRIWLFVGLIGCLAAVAGAAAWFFRAQESGLTRESFRRVHEGMSEAEVVAILGNPTRTGPHAGHRLWVSPSLAAALAFDDDGKVKGGECWRIEDGNHCEGLMRHPETLLDKFCRWLRL